MWPIQPHHRHYEPVLTTELTQQARAHSKALPSRKWELILHRNMRIEIIKPATDHLITRNLDDLTDTTNLYSQTGGTSLLLNSYAHPENDPQ